MNIKLKLKRILITDAGAGAMFSEEQEPPTPGQRTARQLQSVSITLPDAKMVKDLEQGAEYTITITKTKK